MAVFITRPDEISPCCAVKYALPWNRREGAHRDHPGPPADIGPGPRSRRPAVTAHAARRGAGGLLGLGDGMEL